MADSIICDLISVYLFSCNLVHIFWSRGELNNEGSWQLGITQSNILQGQEPVY